MIKLANLGISSIMVEGGAFTFNEFLKHNIVDEALIFIAPKIMGKGITAFTDKNSLSRFKTQDYFQSGSDILVNLRK